MRVSEIWTLTRDEWRNLPFMGMLKGLLAGEQFQIVTPTGHDITVMCDGARVTATGKRAKTGPVGVTISQLRDLLAVEDVSTNELAAKLGLKYGTVYTSLTTRPSEFSHIDSKKGKVWHMTASKEGGYQTQPAGLSEALTALKASKTPLALNALVDATGRSKGTLHSGLKRGLALGLVKKNVHSPTDVTWELIGNGDEAAGKRRSPGTKAQGEADRKYAAIKAYILSHDNKARVQEIAKATKIHQGSVSWQMRKGSHKDDFVKQGNRWTVRKEVS